MRIVSVVSDLPIDSPFLLNKFLGLVDRGLDVRMICLAKSAASGSYSELDASVRSRISFCGQTNSRWAAALSTPFLLLNSLGKNFKGTCHYLSAGWRRFGLGVLRRFYLDAEIVCVRPGLLHFEFGTLAAGRMYLRELLDCRVVVSFRGYDLNFVGLDHPNHYGDVWDGADALHFLGQDLWRRAKERGCPADKRHVLISPAIDSEFLNPNQRRHSDSVGTKGRPLRIVSVGRLAWKKGYDYGLQAVRLLLDQGVDCEYHIVGDGDYFEAVAFARHQLGLTDEVTLMGRLGPHQVKAQMEWADVFLHPAVSEGFCNAVLEAQAMMLPVVCTDADGLSENVADGESGFVVQRRNPEAMAERIGLLAGNASLREKMGNAGRKRVLERFQLKEQIRAFEELYLDILSPPTQEQKLVLDRIETAHAG